jgi:vacuolar-type H+-ATPase subunit E/Vma4
MANLAALLDKEAGAEIEAIVEEARQRASSIIDEAKREAEAIEARHARHAEQQREALLVRAQSAAQLEASSMRLNAQQGAIQQVFDAVESEVSTLVGDAGRYASVFEALLREAVGSQSASPDRVVVNPSDAELAKTTLGSLGVDAPVETADDVVGGVRLAYGKTNVANTLSGRLDALRDDLASDVAHVLTPKES